MDLQLLLDLETRSAKTKFVLYKVITDSETEKRKFVLQLLKEKSIIFTVYPDGIIIERIYDFGPHIPNSIWDIDGMDEKPHREMIVRYIEETLLDQTIERTKQEFGLKFSKKGAKK